MKSRLIWMVTLLVQQKLARRSLNSIYMESHQQSNVFLSIFPMNTMSTSMHTRLLVLARQNVEKTQLTAWFDYNSAHDDSLGLTY